MEIVLDQIPDSDVHIYMDKLAEVYGPIYTLYTPWPTVVLTQYEHIKECLVSRGEHFSTVPLFYLQFELLQPVSDRGILACNGDKWCAQREVTLKILFPATLPG
uniref:Cytochrome P450 n=1 Tax=Ditylenchus dipsaci TaxID=166011 RepID=A0A915EBZ4_9BILA